MFDLKTISQAKNKITEGFFEQCAFLKDELGYYTCGQHLLSKGTKQQGMHGVAAALSVLSQVDEEKSRDILKGLIALVERKFSEYESLKKGGKDIYPHDSNNTIKSCELVAAMSSLPAVLNKENLLVKHVEHIRTNMLEDGGWDYFLMNGKSSFPLPTAFAVLALYKAGVRRQEIESSLRYLFGVISAAGAQDDLRSGVSVKVFCLYVLSILEYRVKELLPLFQQFWDKLKPLMNENIEQNIEYIGSKRYRYVRVPWQLYLLSTSAQLKCSNCFAQKVIRNKIDYMLDAVIKNGGLRYPDSGTHISSRTNAIVYTLLCQLEELIKHNGKSLQWHAFWDHLRGGINSSVTKWTVRAVAFAVLLYASYRWFVSSDADLADIGGGAISSALLLLFSLKGRN